MATQDSIKSRLAALSPEQRTMLEKRLMDHAMASAGAKANTAHSQVSGSTPASQSIPRQPRPDGRHFPLSFAQHRIWFLEQFSPGSCLYNVPLALKIEGALQIRALQQSLNQLVRRHEVLRTTFPTIDGEPVQVIADEQIVSIAIVEFDESSAQEEIVKQRCNQETRRPFDLAQGPLLRATVFRLSSQLHILLLVMHHSIADGWSLEILTRELAAFYNALSCSETAVLAELPIQYSDFATWQRRAVGDDRMQAQLAYWRRHLEGAPEVLNLPTDFPRPAVESFVGDIKVVTWPAGFGDQLKDFSQREGVTLFMLLLAAFQTLLHRYSGQDEIVIGTPIAGRTRSELEGLMGCFVNTLALRGSVEGNPTVRELLARVRDTALEGYAHQEVPFERVVEELKPERGLGHNPLFQAMLILQNAPAGLAQFRGVRAQRLDINSGTAKFDLALCVTENPQGFRVSLNYGRDLFADQTVDRMLGHFRIILEQMLRKPDCPVGSLPMLEERERRQILLEWNATDVSYPRERPLHSFIEEQAERTPEAIAVVFESSSLTYRELNQRANQLAHRLRKSGVGPDALVGVCADRSIEMVVGLLGAMKAGGAYVPLDPGYPRERLATMLQDAGPAVVLTQQHLRHMVADFSGQFFCLDRDWRQLQGEPHANPEVQLTAKNLAYAIYTSGSTGKPKAVGNVHEAIVNRLLWMQDAYRLDATDRVLQKTPYSFDVSVWEFFWPLMVGARLVVAAPGGHQDPDYLVRLITEQRITTCHFVPSMLRIFLEAQNVERCSSLRRVFCSGEALARETQDRFFQRVDAELHNLYGPTEAAVDVTYWPCRRDAPYTSVPIGRPVANTQIYILDRYLQPVPVGVAGELHIGGIQLARGYLNRPELTAEKFIPDHFSAEPDARLYKTGDLARFFPDGNVEYLGRIDNQVKIRGFRIELGEIEAVLGQHSGIQEALVIATAGDGNDKRLVAYFVPSQTEAPTMNELRSYLKEKLPEYMIPSAFVAVAAFPLSSNGKVDRRALPPPQDQHESDSQDLIEPRTAVEELVAGIWNEVLKRSGVGVNKNFFDIGGHSLLATQVVSRVRKVFRVELPLRALFEAPTVAELARRIELERGDSKKTGLAASLSRSDRNQRLPLSFAQQRLWFLDQLEPGNPLYNVPRAVRINGRLNLDALRRSLNEVVRRHEVLRTTFTTVEEEPVQVIASELEVELPVVELASSLRESREEEAMRMAREEAQTPFNLGKGPLLRAKLLQLDDQDHVLLLTMHHIVSDGWSSGILWSEMESLYEAYSQGQGSRLPELALQYADYAMWQRNWLQGEVLENQLAFWRGQLQGAPAYLPLPADRSRPPVRTFEGAVEPIPIPATLSENLKILARREGATLFMTLFAAFATLLHRYSGQEDLVIGTDLANRTALETEQLIGFFINLVPLRARLDGDPVFRHLLAQVRETALGAYAHQEMPFEKLVEELRLERSASHNPLVQVLFVQQNTPPPKPKLGDLTLRPFASQISKSKFDLAVFVSDVDGALMGHWMYSKELFDVATVRRMGGHFETLLANVVAQPEARLSALQFQTAAEREQQEHEKKSRKISKFKRLMSVETRAVELSSAPVSAELGDKTST